MSNDKLQQALAAFKSGDKAAARQMVAVILKVQPTNADAWYMAAFMTEDADKRIQLLERTLAIDPNHAQAQITLRKLRPVPLVDPLDEIISKSLDNNTQTAQPVSPPKRRRSPLLIVLMILGGIALVIGFSFPEVRKLNSNIEQNTTAYYKVTATGALLPVPVKLPQSELNQVIGKCLGHAASNSAGMYDDFIKYLLADIRTGNMRGIGGTSHIYMGEYCNASESFQVAWNNYTTSNEIYKTINMDKNIAWSIFLVGWEDINEVYANETATTTAYRALQPTEIEATPKQNQNND